MEKLGLKFKIPNLKFAARRPLSEKGVTIIEALMVMAVIGFVMSLISVLAYTGVSAWQKQSVRIQLESQAQNFMYVLSYNLRQAQPGSVAISNYPGEMNESMISFTLTNGSNPVSIYLKTIKNAAGTVMDRQVFLSEPRYKNAATPTPTYATGGELLATNVVSLYFTFPKISDTSRVLANIALQKSPMKNKLPVIYQAQQVIYVRN